MTYKSSATSKRHELKERRRKRQQQQKLITILSIVGAAVLIIAIAAGPSIREAFTPVGEISEPEARDYSMVNFNTLGDPTAPVTIIEYSDFQCIHCKNFSDSTESLLVEEYIETGKVHFKYVPMNWVSRNFESRNAAEAAYCAGDQDKFWEYKDVLFANWQGVDIGSYSDKRLVAYAESLDLDMEAFNQCYDNQTYRDLVEDGYQDGMAAGVTGTPAFVINGSLIEFINYEQLKAEIELSLVGGR